MSDETILELAAQLAEARETNSRLHRRVQAAESTATKAMRQWDNSAAWKTVDYLRRWREWDRAKMIMWKRRYRAMRDLAIRLGATEEARLEAIDRADGRVPTQRQSTGEEK